MELYKQKRAKKSFLVWAGISLAFAIIFFTGTMILRPFYEVDESALMQVSATVAGVSVTDEGDYRISLQEYDATLHIWKDSIADTEAFAAVGAGTSVHCKVWKIAWDPASKGILETAALWTDEAEIVTVESFEAKEKPTENAIIVGVSIISCAAIAVAAVLISVYCVRKHKEKQLLKQLNPKK